MADATLRRWHDLMAAGGDSANQAAIEIIRSVGAGTTPKAMLSRQLARSVWHDYTSIAERYNDPGRFTALIGYEWTSNNGGNNQHRVVIFRDGKDKADQIVPFSAFDSENPAMLWKFLDGYTEKTGGDVLAIPHNGNLSNGRMFALVDFDGRGLTRDYAETRARLEPVYEVTQIKGDGEAHPFLSPNDEFAGFELWDKGNLDLTELKKPEMLQYEYALRAKDRPQARTGTRRQSVQVWHDRLDRLAHVAGDRRPGQFLRQTQRCRAERYARHPCFPRLARRRRKDHGLGDDRLRLCGGVGDR